MGSSKKTDTWLAKEINESFRRYEAGEMEFTEHCKVKQEMDKKKAALRKEHFEKLVQEGFESGPSDMTMDEIRAEAQRLLKGR